MSDELRVRIEGKGQPIEGLSAGSWAANGRCWSSARITRHIYLKLLLLLMLLFCLRFKLYWFERDKD